MKSTCDLYDEFSETVKVCNIQFHSYGANDSVSGLIQTVKCYQDNTEVKRLLSEKTEYDILMVDGGGNIDFALLGDLIADNALKNHWKGIIINGAVRDIENLMKTPIHIKAIGNIPRKTDRKGQGLSGVPLNLNGIIFNQGDFIVSDKEGLLNFGNKIPDF